MTLLGVGGGGVLSEKTMEICFNDLCPLIFTYFQDNLQYGMALLGDILSDVGVDVLMTFDLDLLTR